MIPRLRIGLVSYFLPAALVQDGGINMPLHDHFHPPLSERRPWESFHATWCGSLADYLNRDVLSSDFIALEQIHSGAAIEIDVGTNEGVADVSAGGVATMTKAVWTPTAPPVRFPASFLEQFSVEIHSTEGGRTLVAAVELISPGDKDREQKRKLFAAKCAAYLARGVGLVIIDVVTSRRENLHNEFVDLIDVDESLRMPDEEWIYTVAYRPISQTGQGTVECWPIQLEVGIELPVVPLSLAADLCLAVDLEIAYADACRRRRIGEVVAE